MALSLRVENITKGYGQTLFSRLSLRVQTPAKIALIGDNGTGKSVFLKILAGIENPDMGEISWGQGCQVGYLPQEILGHDEASGGEKKIALLKKLFYSDNDVILLDEPDNHLDLEHKRWFSHLVKKFTGILIIISHDRHLLKTCFDHTWLLEDKEIKAYPFSYDKFRSLYFQDRLQQAHLWQVQEKERLRLKTQVERFKQWAKLSNKFAGRYQSAIRRYEKFVAAMVKKPEEKNVVNFQTNTGKTHLRKTALHLQDIKKAYREPVLKGVNLHLFCGQKISIQAPNGSGKSTLLNIIAQKLAPDSGQVDIGPGLTLGYYAQEHLEALGEEETPLSQIQKTLPLSYQNALSHLGRFLFNNQLAQTKIKYLSGGQKSRLQLAQFLGKNPHLLILDEPSNHLDIPTIESLENFLSDYQGTLVLVSHDRELVKNTVSEIYDLKDGLLVKRI